MFFQLLLIAPLIASQLLISCNSTPINLNSQPQSSMSFPIRSLVSSLCKLTLNLPLKFQLSLIWLLILSIYIPEISRLLWFGQFRPYQDYYVHVLSMSIQ